MKRRLAVQVPITALALALLAGVTFSTPAQAVDWLESSLRDGPTAEEDTPVELRRPGGVPEALLTALDNKFATMAGAVKLAYLAGVTYESGRKGHLSSLDGLVTLQTPGGKAHTKSF